MQIRMQKVKLLNRNVRQMYLDAFPAKERMPFPMMVLMSKLWNTDFQGVYDGDNLCGFIYLAHNRKMVFIMFLAVDESLRSKGYGSAILQEIQKKYSNKKIIVSIEPCCESAPDIELREKRKAFYMRNGYKESGYWMKLSGVEQEILISNGEFDSKEFRLFFLIYSNGTVWPKIWKKEV